MHPGAYLRSRPKQSMCAPPSPPDSLVQQLITLTTLMGRSSSRARGPGGEGTALLTSRRAACERAPFSPNLQGGKEAGGQGADGMEGAG